MHAGEEVKSAGWDCLGEHRAAEWLYYLPDATGLCDRGPTRRTR